MKKILVTVYFDNKDNLKLEDRYHDRFIIETAKGNFRTKLFEICEIKKYAYPDFRKIRQGYEAVENIETYNLTDLEIFTDESLEINSVEKELEEWDLEL